MTIGSVQLQARLTGEWLEVDGFCTVCNRLLCYGEYEMRACWTCSPELAPLDLEQHLIEVRTRSSSRAKSKEGRQVAPMDRSARTRVSADL